MATKKIYIVSRKGELGRLVRAPNQAQALRQVAQDFTVTLASQDALVRLLTNGVKVEDAGEQPEGGQGDLLEPAP